MMKEQTLYECALAVEKDSALKKEMADWDVTVSDGLDANSWLDPANKSRDVEACNLQSVEADK